LEQVVVVEAHKDRQEHKDLPEQQVLKVILAHPEHKDLLEQPDLKVQLGTQGTTGPQGTAGPQGITGTQGTSGVATFPYTGSAIITGSLTVTGSTVSTLGFTGSLFGTASYSTQAANTNTINISSFGSPVESYLLMSNVVATTGVAIGGDSELRYNSSTNVLTVPNVTSSFTGSLLGTASFAISASQTVSSSYALSSSYSVSGSRAVSSSYALTSSYALNSTSASYALNANSSSFATSALTASYINPLSQPVLISGSTTITGSTILNGDVTVTSATTIDLNTTTLNINAPTFQVPSFGLPYSPSANVRTVMYDAISNALYVTGSLPGSITSTGSFTGSFTGSLLGTASYATSALTASYALSSSVSVTSSFAVSSSRAVTSSFAISASSVNTLNQNVVVTGSLTVSSTTAGSSENTLTLGPAPGGGTGEGGQLGLNAAGGSYTSASFLDTWQDQFRVLRGSNAGSNAGLMYMNLQTGNTQFVGSVTASAFNGLPNDYLYATRSGSNQTVGSSWANTDIVFNNVAVSKGISFNTSTGVASLTGGKVYRVTARLAWSAAATYLLQFSCYTSANTQIGPTIEIVQSTNGTNNISDGTLDFIYAPSGNTDIKIRTTSNTNALSGEQIRADLNTQFIIQQIA